MYHGIGENYMKNGERLPCGSVDTFGLSHYESTAQFPKQMGKFWKCPDIEIDLRLLSRAYTVSRLVEFVVGGKLRSNVI